MEAHPKVQTVHSAQNPTIEGSAKDCCAGACVEQSMAAVSKKRRIEEQKGNLPRISANDSATPSSTGSPMPAAPVRLDVKSQQAKKFAVIQTQQEGCLGIYRSFDSPYGNYLVPVIPARCDLFS